MNRESLDPRIEKMIASIYGELSVEEEERFQKMLAEDPTLRTEYEELAGTRTLLEAWELDESEATPRFVLTPADPFVSSAEDSTGSQPLRQPRGLRHDAGFFDRLRAAIGRLNMPLGWGLTATALVLAVLAIADFRVQLIDNGLSFTFGKPESPTMAMQNGAPQMDPRAVDGRSPDVIHPGAAVLRPEAVLAAKDDSPYIMREDFEHYATNLSRVMNEVLLAVESEEERSKDFTGFMRAMYQGLNDRQSKDYYDLRGRIEAVRLGLNEVQTTRPRFEEMFDTNPGEPLIPKYSGPASKEGEEKGDHDQ